ncbi:MAG: transposase [Chloroflexi bacterium]|nr:transposase [Chloroflexota bacterium]
MREFVRRAAAPKAAVYSDGHGAYTALEGEFKHRAVQHAAGTYVIFDTHTNGIDGFWSQLKRGYHGTYTHWSVKHTARYLDEFTGRANARAEDTVDQMAAIAKGMVGKRLRFRELVA